MTSYRYPIFLAAAAAPGLAGTVHAEGIYGTALLGMNFQESDSEPYGDNFQTTQWESTDAFALSNTVVVFGKMNGITTKSGKETGEFIFALCTKVRDGQVVLWQVLLYFAAALYQQFDLRTGLINRMLRAENQGPTTVELTHDDD